MVVAYQDEETETMATPISVNGESVTEQVSDAEYAAYRRAQRRNGRFVTSSVMAGGGGFYVTTTPDPR